MYQDQPTFLFGYFEAHVPLDLSSRKDLTVNFFRYDATVSAGVIYDAIISNQWMSTGQFPEKLADEIKYYVYRLIDPRNGQTFYVGKGKGNRVFMHVQGDEHDPDDYWPGSTQERIAQIHFAGLSVGHIIHRHGMTERTALEVEGALIDCYQRLHPPWKGGVVAEIVVLAFTGAVAVMCCVGLAMLFGSR